jgi:hypothetical protein
VRSAFDGFVLGAFLGLGFQVVEDVIYVVQAADAHFGADQTQVAIDVIGARSRTALTSHVMYSALFCAGFVYLLGRSEEPARRVRGIVLILVAMVAHGVWNAQTALPSGGNASLVVLLAVFVVYRMTVRRKRDWFRDVMAPEVERGVITKEELDALSGTLRDYRTYIEAGKGHRSRGTSVRVLKAIRDLAKQIGHARGDDTAEVRRARAEIACVRAGAPRRGVPP